MKTVALGIGVSGLSLIPLIADNKYLLYFLGLVVAYTFGFIFTYFFGFKEEMAEKHIEKGIPFSFSIYRKGDSYDWSFNLPCKKNE